MSCRRPASSQKGEEADDMRSSSSNADQASLHVPSPEHVWTRLMMGRLPAALSSDAPPTAPFDTLRATTDEARSEGDAVSRATTSPIFRFPFSMAAGLSNPSFPGILPTLPIPLSEDTACASSGAHGPKRRRSDDAMATAQPLSLYMVSKSSFPSVFASEETMHGRDEGHSDATASLDVHQQVHATEVPISHSTHPQPDPSAAVTGCSIKTHGCPDFVTPLAHPVASPETSFLADLFVGLQRPRLHGRGPLEPPLPHHCHTHPGDGVDVDSQASLSSSSPSLALDQISSVKTLDGIISDEDTSEDEDGADTPTVYCGTHLPHWWRSIVTPVPGTRVSLRPGTRRLEFWWIDRLGSEAYEIIRIVLKHAIEGVVLRRSSESAIVVEFHIPPHLLKSTSYGVAGSSHAPRDVPQGSVGGAGDMSESASMPFLTDRASSSTRAPSLTSSQPVDTAETSIFQSSRSPSRSTAVVPLETPPVTNASAERQCTHHQNGDGSGAQVECSRRESAEPLTTGANAATDEATWGGGGDKRAAPSTQVCAHTAPLLPPPSPHRHSTSEAVAGQSTDPSVEQQAHRLALPFVIGTTPASKHQQDLSRRPAQTSSPVGPEAPAVVRMTSDSAGGHGEKSVNSLVPTNATRIIDDVDSAAASMGSILSMASTPASPLRRCPSAEPQSPCDKPPSTVKVISAPAPHEQRGSPHSHLSGSGDNQPIERDKVAASPLEVANHMAAALSLSGHCDPALSDRGWQRGCERAQDPQSQQLPSNSNTISKRATATAEAVDFSVARVPTRAKTTTPSRQRQPELLGASRRAMAENDDSVVVILTLPTSMCTPIIVVRLHAMRLLHPLLRTITASYTPAVSPSISRDGRQSDNTDTESTEEGAPPAASLSDETPLSSPAGNKKDHDYASAIHIFNEAIELLKKGKGLGGEMIPPRRPPRTTTTKDNALLRARDLSILYTVRSHLFFHTSSVYLHHSLQDAERAMRCCPSRDHMNATYEILAANLISLGYTAHLEALAGYLRHHWRAASPLLLRLGRVIQVMVSYTSIFLNQQYPTSMLRLCEGGSMSDNAVNTSTDRPHRYSPPPTPQATEGMTPCLSHLGARRSWRATTAASADTTTTRPQVHTLPYEVCPLLLGSYGSTLHAPDEPLLPMPLPLPPPSAPATGTESGSAEPMPYHRYPARPPHPRSSPGGSHLPSRSFQLGTDVCHRRLFLLKTLFPSMNPKPVSQLPCPVPRRRQGTQTIGQPKGAHMSINDHGRENTTRSSTVVVPRSNPVRQVRAEDLMYDQDSLFSLLAATADTTMHWGTVPMSYFCRHVRLSATRCIQKGESILMERPAVLMPLWPLLPSGSAVDGSAPTSPCCTHYNDTTMRETTTSIPSAPWCCSYCGRQKLAKPVPCPGGCDSVYCSNQCRELALRLYHVVECGGVPRDSEKANIVESGEDLSARVQRTVATLQNVFSNWNNYLRHLARRESPSTRLTTSHGECSPMPASGVSSMSPPRSGPISRHNVSPPQERCASEKTSRTGEGFCTPRPFLAVTAMRMVARLLAMIMSMVLPVELLPQMQNHPTWAAERYEMMRAVSRTLRQRGLRVPLASTSETALANAHCTHVDPHQLLLLEVLLQQLSVPFFADFNYRSSSTVWEGLRRIPCEVTREADNTTDKASLEKSVTSPLNNPGPGMPRRLPFHYTSSRIPDEWQRQRNCLPALTPTQLEEVICDLHSMVRRLKQAITEGLADVPSLPLSGAEAVSKNNVEWGFPGQWHCIALLGFLTSTRALQQISDFALTSWAVVYPRGMEPPNVAAAMTKDNCGVPQGRSVSVGDKNPMNSSDEHHHTPSHADDLSRANPRQGPRTAAVPLAVISPWSCLTVDLHPLQDSAPSGTIHSRFMVEHEQRRRMLAYCAAAAGHRGGDGISGIGENEDSFLSVQSEKSANSVATLHSGSDSAQARSLMDDASLEVLEEMAQRSGANVQISIVYTPTEEPAVLVVAKKNIHRGDALWWESLHCSEYLSAFP